MTVVTTLTSKKQEERGIGSSEVLCVHLDRGAEWGNRTDSVEAPF